MGRKNKVDENPLYQEAVDLRDKIKVLNHEIAVINEAIAQMQVDRITHEIETGDNTSPFWVKWFRMKKRVNSNCNGFFVEEGYYGCSNSISLSEPELLFLKGYKENLIKNFNEQVSELSAKISEDD